MSPLKKRAIRLAGVELALSAAKTQFHYRTML
jgi:hypothetical protein